jgi:altronate hydrolase
VHTHDLATLLRGEEEYRYEPVAAAPLPSASATFDGYCRADGRVGTRNEIWILPTVGCVARTSERIAGLAHARRPEGVDGVYAFAHPFGCS